MASRKRRFITVTCLILIAGVLLAWYLATRPATGSIQKKEASVPAATASIPQEHQAFGLTFTLPGEYQQRGEEELSEDRQSIRFMTSGGDATTRRFVIIKETRDEPLEEYPAIKSRRLQPEKYTEQAVTVSGQEGIEFANTGGGTFERTIFLKSGSHIISLALSATTGFGAEKAAGDYGIILPSIQLSPHE